MPFSRTPPLITCHNRFLRDGKPFLFRGVVYQLGFRRWQQPRTKPSSLPPHERYADRDVFNDDRLEDLKRDLILFKELGINALWTYTVCTGASHDQAMQLLSENGIYVFIGCSAPGNGESINRSAPHTAYERPLLERCYGVVDGFCKYDNVAGFVVSGHVVNSPETTNAAEVVKAVIRDVKAYVALAAREHNRRSVPVGLADDAWAATQTPSLTFYIAGPPEDRADFYAFVDFSWGLDEESETASWSGLAQPDRFAASKVPVLICEYGGNLRRPRHFPETTTLYDATRKEVFSGGFAYEFYEEANRYGLVKDSEEGLTKLDDFQNLRLRLRESQGAEEGLRFPESDQDFGELPTYPVTSHTWRASAGIPQQCPLPAEEYLRQMRGSTQ